MSASRLTLGTPGSRLASHNSRMAPRTKSKYSTREIEAQLSQLFLYSTSTSSTSSSSTNDVDLGPILLNIHKSGQQDDYLTSLRAFVQEKEAEIEQVCINNYQVRSLFLSLVSRLRTGGGELTNGRNTSLGVCRFSVVVVESKTGNGFVEASSDRIE